MKDPQQATLSTIENQPTQFGERLHDESTILSGKKQETSRRDFFGAIGALTAVGLVAGAEKPVWARRLHRQSERRTWIVVTCLHPMAMRSVHARLSRFVCVRRSLKEIPRCHRKPPMAMSSDTPTFIGDCTKGLPHDAPGLVNPSAYQLMLTAECLQGANGCCI